MKKFPQIETIMVEIAAHLIDQVLPGLPFRQFVISFPMRIRCYLENHATLQTVLKIVVDEIRKRIIVCSPSVQSPQIGAISFIQHFGKHLHPEHVRRILRGLGWPITVPEFDPP